MNAPVLCYSYVPCLAVNKCIYCAVRARFLFWTCMIVWNASGVTRSSRNVTIHMPQDAETPLNEPPYLIRLNFTAIEQLSAPVLPHPNSYNMPRNGDSVTLRADCSGKYCNKFSEWSLKQWISPYGEILRNWGILCSDEHNLPCHSVKTAICTLKSIKTKWKNTSSCSHALCRPNTDIPMFEQVLHTVTTVL